MFSNIEINKHNQSIDFVYFYADKLFYIMSNIDNILKQESFSKSDLVQLLSADGKESEKIHKLAADVKSKHIGNYVHYRGLVEMSNVCDKNCYYCGIRKDNFNQDRYNLSDKEVIEAAMFAHQNQYGSFVIQSGEIESSSFTNRIENLLKEIKRVTNNELGITISLGEQSHETYKRWFDAGAHRYLLRIESSNRDLFYKIHPEDENHSFETRMNCLQSLQDIGYQTGTGVMVGLPFQTMDDLANDLLFMQEFDIDMCGMGPYVEHKQTPLYEHKHLLITQQERFDLTLKMIALLRIMMKDINIAAATALQAIDPVGREKAIKVGANIIMPNITPGDFRNSYKLYENKPCTNDTADQCKACLGKRVSNSGHKVALGEWGDSKHYHNRVNK